MADSGERLAIAFVLVAAGLIAIGWVLFSGPSPVELAKQEADGKAQAKEQALRDLKEKIDAEERRHMKLEPEVQKRSKEICESHTDWGVRACDAVAQRQIFVGMKTEQVVMSWGKPRTVNPLSIRREQWVYPSASVDFENGLVTSFQQSR